MQHVSLKSLKVAMRTCYMAISKKSNQIFLVLFNEIFNILSSNIFSPISFIIYISSLVLLFRREFETDVFNKVSYRTADLTSAEGTSFVSSFIIYLQHGSRSR